MSEIIWTKIDEAPALATQAFLPIVKAFVKEAGIDVTTRDISLAGRVLATFPERLTDEQKVDDHLTELGQLVGDPKANIIKLPNISASIPQLQACIKELQDKGYSIPDFPENPEGDDQQAIRARYASVLGSAVNPVLREGNSDRRAAASVKAFALKNPHRMMKEWPAPGQSDCRVAYMADGDFYGSEKSMIMDSADTVTIRFVDAASVVTNLRDIALLEGEVFDSSVMNVAKLRAFYAATAAEAKRKGVLLSLHLKATMMKVSDPVLFGHCIAVFFKPVLEKHAALFERIGVNVNLGLGDILARVERLPDAEKAEVLTDIEACYEQGPDLAMVDSVKGITNLHVPSDVIIDASMPNVVRDGGKMWNRSGQLQDTIAMVPDRCYATIYAEIIDDAREKGQFDPSTMGSVANVGLMAKKAEEYGSHDKTFVAPAVGRFEVVASDGRVLMTQAVESGDIFRGCQTKDVAIRDWIKLAFKRSEVSGEPVVFWLDRERGHDAQLIAKLNSYLAEQGIDAGGVKIMAPQAAMRYSLAAVREGQNVIAATGNVLRDYLTDLFPILELGTSARMLSIVPLINGGGLFETGAGGSAPKHVQQFLAENHLRWDSLGEYCALVPALEQAASADDNAAAGIMAQALDQAIGEYLQEQKLPSRKAGEIDNRGSSFWLTLYWAEALAAQQNDVELQQRFAPLARELRANSAQIDSELMVCQGRSVDCGGYYMFDALKVARAMRPSAIFNAIIDAM